MRKTYDNLKKKYIIRYFSIMVISTAFLLVCNEQIMAGESDDDNQNKLTVKWEPYKHSNTITTSPIERHVKQYADEKYFIMQDDSAYKEFFGAKPDKLRQDKNNELDWTKYVLVALIGGKKSTGGYSVEVKSVELKVPKKDNHILQVDWVLNGPPTGARVSQRLTYPYTVIKIEKPTEPYEFFIKKIKQQKPENDPEISCQLEHKITTKNRANKEFLNVDYFNIEPKEGEKSSKTSPQISKLDLTKLNEVPPQEIKQH